MSSVTYRPAPAVQRIADELIPKHHSDLADVDMRYVFRSEHAKSSGKAVFGRAKKVSGLNAYLAQTDEPDETGIEGNDGDFFVIEIAEDIWSELSSNQRVALVDHELCHCGVTYDKDENLKLVCRPHDLEEFRAVVERHGMWAPDVKAMADSMQLRLEVGAERAVQDLVDSVPDGMKMSVSVNGGEEQVVADKRADEVKVGDSDPIDTPKRETKQSKVQRELAEKIAEIKASPGSAGSASTEAAPVAGDSSADGSGDEATGERRTVEGEEQTAAATAAEGLSSHADRDDNAGPDAVVPPSQPQKATPAQRLALGRHIGQLDEKLTDEYLQWCRKKKVDPNPEHMTFDQARSALLLVGEREAVASA